MDSVDIKSRALSQLGATEYTVKPDLTVVYGDNNAIAPSTSDITDKIALITVQEARKKAYADWRDQLDMQYKDSLNGTTTWNDHISKVKSDNPKPLDS